MSNTPAWSENLSVGNNHVDHQHQQLIDLCNRAADCAASTLPESRSQFHAILNELATLASKHFEDEEAWATGQSQTAPGRQRLFDSAHADDGPR